MLIEILIYVALFTALFSGVFSSAFETQDALRYLQNQKNTFDDLYFLQARLDTLVQTTTDWQNLSSSTIEQSISSGQWPAEFVSSQIVDTSTSSNRVLFLILNINKKPYTFSYVQKK